MQKPKVVFLGIFPPFLPPFFNFVSKEIALDVCTLEVVVFWALFLFLVMERGILRWDEVRIYSMQLLLLFIIFIIVVVVMYYFLELLFLLLLLS